jgi:N6-L-threonylcarbamoyladenine synthase
VNTPVVLGIETSCDETSVGIIDGDLRIVGHVILSQDVHEVYGGVVPELAARQHLIHLDRVVDRALGESGLDLQSIDAIAATAGPGLVGALLVGLGWARAAALALELPMVPVHHMEAHLFAPSLEDAAAVPPFVGLLVSGGHTLLLWVPEWGRYELLGETRDDAAGEAFDKVAKLLGLPYPGGRPLSELATEGDPEAFAFPRPMLRSNQGPGDRDYFDMSFSGLKTAVLQTVRELESAGRLDARRADVAASFQAAVVELLVEKTMRAVAHVDCPHVLLGGGVSANRPLREAMSRRLGATGRVSRSSPRLAMDNGAMIARAGRFHLDRGLVVDPNLTARPDLPFPGLRRRAD